MTICFGSIPPNFHRSTTTKNAKRNKRRLASHTFETFLAVMPQITLDHTRGGFNLWPLFKMSEAKDATPTTPAAPKLGTPSIPAIVPAAPNTSQEDTNAVDDSHKEAAPAAAEQPDPDAGEEKLYGEKAMLYRFDKSSNDWKERGVGFIKILKNIETGRCRILMRRNQTFRVCANHFILPHMELKPHTGSDRALIWSANDYADGAESHDVLSVRFRTPEIAQEFKKAFEEARAINKAALEKLEAGAAEGEKKEEPKTE